MTSQFWRWITTVTAPLKWTAVGGIVPPMGVTPLPQLVTTITKKRQAAVWVPSPAVFVSTAHLCAKWAADGWPQCLILPTFPKSSFTPALLTFLTSHASRAARGVSAGQRMLAAPVMVVFEDAISPPLIIPAVAAHQWDVWLFAAGARS